MFSKSICRVARSTPSLPISSATVARATAGSPHSSSRKASGLHQRRYSSSKPSCPPDGSGKSEADAASAPGETSTRRPGSSTRLPRRKAKEAAEEIALKARDAAFARLPAVPPTSHMTELDVKMASVFSMHRPISVTKPWPQHTTTASFNAIFEPRSSTSKVSDVIYTLSSTVSAIEGAAGQQTQEEKDLRWEMLQEFTSHNAATPIDGTRSQPVSLDKIISQYRPFNVPPAPVPFPEKQETSADRQQQQQPIEEPQSKTFTTTLTISESISSTGRKTYTASASPIVEQSLGSRPRQRLITREREAARMQARTARTELGIPETILEEEEEETSGRTMQLISVKRQRKLKMKKHKYKKLMRKTRNLRRRIGRT